MMKLNDELEITITQKLQVNGVISIPKPVRERLSLKIGDLITATIKKV